MRLENKHNAPQAFMNFCADDDYSRGDSDFSATDLIEEPRIIALRNRHPDFGVEDPYENPWKFIGTMFHSAMEKYAPASEISEERIFSSKDGVKISGAMDVQIVKEGRVSIGDYKTTTVFALKDTKKWEEQLNIYAWLVERERGLAVEKLTIYAFLRNWSITMSEKIKGYPETPGITVDIDLWDFGKRDDFVRDRIEKHKKCEPLDESDLPPCSHEARWPSGTLYVVQSLDDKGSAFFKTKREAKKYYEDLAFDKQMTAFQDKTYETYRRCKSYCVFSKICKQWENWQEERENQNV